MLSPLPRRGSRFWGRAEGSTSPLWESSRAFWVRTDCRKPPVREVLDLGGLSFVLPNVTDGGWVEEAEVGDSLSGKEREININTKINWQERQEKKKRLWVVLLPSCWAYQERGYLPFTARHTHSHTHARSHSRTHTHTHTQVMVCRA